ncbi:hypothetical protein [Gloeobacter kilaueensis]|uniref:hypothetical protein n=1 Tax=Gloeobacter kilaueensis TaxID=1416614 RepID=UPI00059CEBD7|nr:hypothetical protein [Gloeobacter kilaueensis]
MIDFFLDRLGLTPAVCAGFSLWALALYLVFIRFNQRLVDLLCSWLNDADRSLFSEQTLNRRPKGWEERNQLFASILSVLPSLGLGLGLFLVLNTTLGSSWAIASGLLIAIGAGVYQLGRQDAENSRRDRRP